MMTGTAAHRRLPSLTFPKHQAVKSKKSSSSTLRHASLMFYSIMLDFLFLKTILDISGTFPRSELLTNEALIEICQLVFQNLILPDSAVTTTTLWGGGG